MKAQVPIPLEGCTVHDSSVMSGFSLNNIFKRGNKEGRYR